MFISTNRVRILFLFLFAWVSIADGRKTLKLGNSVSKRQDQIDNEDKLDFLFDDYIDYYPNDLAYLTDAVKKTFPASTHSQTSVNQDSYPAASSSSCNTEKKKISKRKKFGKNRAKAIIILGRMRSAFSSFFSAITSIASDFSETTPESTSVITTTTMPTTTETKRTSTTTSTVKRMSMTCSTTTATTGQFKTIRNQGQQVEQCLSITVPTGEKIQFTCTSVYTNTGTYVMFYDQLGTNLIVDTPTVNVVYTTSDNTLLIKSLASSVIHDQLCCDWTTVVAFKNIFVKSKPNGPYLLKG